MTQPLYTPAGFEKWNPALRGAYRKGQAARRDGRTFEACPYDDKRTPSGQLSWSRAFIRAWQDGWQDEHRLSTEQPIEN